MWLSDEPSFLNRLELRQTIKSTSATRSPPHFKHRKKRRMSRVFTDNIGSFNVSNSYNNAITLIVADDETKILAWLSPLEPEVRHQDICEQRVDSVGNWLLETNEFRGWYNGNENGGSDHEALFCYGEPGVGKSYIWYGRLLARY